MNRLIEKETCGNWSLKGVCWDDLRPRAKITKETYKKIYAALFKLMDYENTGLNPEDVERINDFERSQSAVMLKKLNEEQRKHRWIPVEDTDHTPENESYVLVSFSNCSLPDIARYEEDGEGGAYYPGDGEKTYAEYGILVNAWMPLPEPYRPDPCHGCFGAANNDCDRCERR